MNRIYSPTSRRLLEGLLLLCHQGSEIRRRAAAGERKADLARAFGYERLRAVTDRVRNTRSKFSVFVTCAAWVVLLYCDWYYMVSS